ncbi:hypothetical protein PR202_ga19445 [Eleusine coracana subsp. coracana]|uniref:Uncharacterized protein n=1 Tax=Eleusine coracana subsp. coracana TaxID=191504 RepID=A0AAV5CW65_ELECO|nr:hypothetical protein PR202_ga19445 [Eleusine coracana subsp. coracana]
MNRVLTDFIQQVALISSYFNGGHQFSALEGKNAGPKIETRKDICNNVIGRHIILLYLEHNVDSLGEILSVQPASSNSSGARADLSPASIAWFVPATPLTTMPRSLCYRY